MENIESTLDLEELIQRQRQEKKDLQSKITSLKKAVPKNDKKKKKEISDQIEKLEQELNEKHKLELESLKGQNGDCDSQTESTLSITESSAEAEPEVKLTRAQRRRNKKELEDKERDKRIYEQEIINRTGPRNSEFNTIKEALNKRGLEIFNVAADGNCLYCSIKHQLEVTGRQSLEINELRKLTADFIRINKDDFLPFMCSDSGELVDEKQFEKYCQQIATTKVWGGQLEIRALSNILKCPIQVIQATGPPTIQGEQYEGTPLVLTYHRHMYRLGEHFNSTIACGVKEEENLEIS